MRTQNNHRRANSLGATALAVLSASTLLSTTAAAQNTNNSTTSPTTSKRGLSIHQGTNTEDFNIFLQKDSPVAWYYTWSPWPNSYIEKAAATNNKKIEFIPLLHGTSNLDADLKQLARVTEDQAHRLLTFNEPDGDTDSGGSDISPRDAAQAYVDRILPLRSGSAEGGRWMISHPVVTGSGRGLDWLKDFCDACEDINGDNGGCPTDFVAAHWYGAFDGLEGWLGQLRDFYKDPKHSFRSDLSTSSSGSKSTSRRARRQSSSEELEIIVTEMGLPQQDDQATQTMLNSSISYLDGQSWVSGYSWFGLFREGSSDASGWAGESVAMLDSSGKLTEVGAMFMGGQEDGFAPGESVGGDQSGDGSGNAGSAAVVTRAQGWAVAACVGLSLSLMMV